ncbi:D-alanine--D-alanine ligase [bacterium]|nr:D-alanine--D-alanine ligase [bacterium]
MARVVVLVGGRSSERAISLKTGLAVAGAFERLGWDLRLLDTGRPALPALPLAEFRALPELGAPDAAPPAAGREAGLPAPQALTQALAPRPGSAWQPDLVFIALHGGSGEDGTVQALLDWLGLPYTGCGMAASALAMDKWRSKMLLRDGGLAVPPGYLVEVPPPRLADPAYPEELARRLEADPGWPAVIKPNREGSSVGLAVLASRAEALAELPGVLAVSGELLVEAFIPGRELTVAVLGGQALPLVEILPTSGLYDYQHKYEKGRTRYVCPAELPPALAARVQADALKAWQLLGCRHLARVDFRLAADGTPYCLEVNTIPGMTETSLFPMAAAAAGLDFPALVAEIARLALADAARRAAAAAPDERGQTPA